jgi:hypothetical protein
VFIRLGSSEPGASETRNTSGAGPEISLDGQAHEKLSAKNYQTQLLIEFAEFVGQSEGAKFVWIERDGNFNFAIDPDDIPDGVQAVPVNAEEELSVVAKA